jgi:hypothetical protein
MLAMHAAQVQPTPRDSFEKRCSRLGRMIVLWRPGGWRLVGALQGWAIVLATAFERESKEAQVRVALVARVLLTFIIVVKYCCLRQARSALRWFLKRDCLHSCVCLRVGFLYQFISISCSTLHACVGGRWSRLPLKVAHAFDII